MRHINYLKYVLRHKWFVMLARRKFGCSFWRAITHDLSKFLPSEWFPYAYTFYDTDGSARYAEDMDFSQAWNFHQKRNKHHWQYWVLTYDRGEVKALVMPVKYIREMLADWAGAGRAISGKWEYKEWYLTNKSTMKLHRFTELIVEILIECDLS